MWITSGRHFFFPLYFFFFYPSPVTATQYSRLQLVTHIYCLGQQGHLWYWYLPMVSLVRQSGGGIRMGLSAVRSRRDREIDRQTDTKSHLETNKNCKERMLDLRKFNLTYVEIPFSLHLTFNTTYSFPPLQYNEYITIFLITFHSRESYLDIFEFIYIVTEISYFYMSLFLHFS